MIELIQCKTDIGRKLESYKDFLPVDYRSCFKHGRILKGKKIMHVNATHKGGGVAELLATQISLERSMGIDRRWFVMDAPDTFFRVTKKIHNMTQGLPGRLTMKEALTYLDTNQELSLPFLQILNTVKPDLVVIHDPQPMPLVKYVPAGIKTILRLHIDFSEPNPRITKFLTPFLSNYSRIIISSKNYIPELPKNVQKRTTVIMPGIDPLSEKNRPMAREKARIITKQLGIDPDRPIVLQVSRFDPWKDPLGVIEAYSMAKLEIQNLQLVLAGIIQAKDDPGARLILEKVKKRAGTDPDIFLFWDQSQINSNSVDCFVSAILTASTVVIQKSIKEGFGLTITEAMWKGKPVIGGNASGVRLQIINNRNGMIVSNTLMAAKAIIKLVRNPKLRNKLGKAARLSVQKRFLQPKYLLENLKVYKQVL